MKRRMFLYGGGGALAILAASTALRRMPAVSDARAESFEVTRTDAEWRRILSKEQYAVLRRESTEYPGTSPLLHEKRAGTFHCAGCDLPLYASTTKYDSGTGWPSFWQALPAAVDTREDNSMMMSRTECHCHRCGGHLGHVFDDGPPPTGKRHCINGVAMTFRPAAA